MDSDAPVKEVLDDLYTLLESIETQNIAILQFLKDQKIAPDEKLRPYLEQAGNASSVKWRAARARMNHLFAPAPKKATEAMTKPFHSEPPAGAGQDNAAAKPQTSATEEQNTPGHRAPDHGKEDQERRDQRDRDQPQPERHDHDQGGPVRRAARSQVCTEPGRHESVHEGPAKIGQGKGPTPVSQHADPDAPLPSAPKHRA